MLFLFMTGPVLQVLRVLDHFFVFGELPVRLLPIAPVAFALAAAAHLADKIRRAHARDLHLENLLHGFLDLRLRRAGRNFKLHGVLCLFHAETLFRDDRPPNNLIVRGRHRYPFPFFFAGFAAFLAAAGFFAAAFGAASFFTVFAAGAIVSTSGTTTGLFSGSTQSPNRATASFQSATRLSSHAY